MDYVRPHVLIPRGTNNTRFILDSAMRGRLATGYALAAGNIDTDRPRRELAGRG